MNKIASSRELQAELQRILTLAQKPNPSRLHLASELHSLADRVAAKVDWTQKGDKYLARVEYAEGEKHEWAISESGDKFTISVKTPKGTFKRKKDFDSLEQAQRYGAKFINRADGDRMLQDALGKDFTKA